MSRWQDEVSNQSSSGGESSSSSSVEITNDDDRQQEPNTKQQSASKHGDKTTLPPPHLHGDGVPRRWITDRIQGVVHGTGGGVARAPRPPCSLCWPPPILGRCPMLLEENILCTTMGRVGFCSDATRRRRRSDYYSHFGNRGRSAVMTYALVMNVAGWLVTMFAALALADANDMLIRLAAFGRADLRPTTDTSTAFDALRLQLGLQALLVREELVVPYVDFCTTPGMEQFLPVEDCNVCHETSLYIIVGLVVATAAYLPTLLADCLRRYEHYDVNCQKTLSFLWSLVSLAGYGLAFYYYNYVCLASFHQGQVLYDSNRNVVSEGGVVVVDFDWKMGTGQICLLAGFGLKCINFLCNCCVATPIITRDRVEQWKYERLSEQAEQGIFVSEKSDKKDGKEDENDDASASEDS